MSSQKMLAETIRRVCKVSKKEAKKFAKYIGEKQVIYSIMEGVEDREILMTGYEPDPK